MVAQVPGTPPTQGTRPGLSKSSAFFFLKSSQIMKIAHHLRAVGAPKAPVDQHIKVVGKHVQQAAL